MACEPNQELVAKVELRINGREIELNTFVTNFISETITGMVKPLRGVEDIETINLSITRAK